ncbi:MAG: MFS transporter [Blastocatellia bacterium]
MSQSQEEAVRESKASRNAVLVLLLEGFLSRLSFSVLGFALPLFAYRRLGLSLTQTGFLFSVNLMSEQLFKPLMGWVADRAGVKRIFTASIALRSLVALLLVFAGAPWQVYAIRFLHGFAESLRDPSVAVLIAVNARETRLASTFGWYTTAKQSAGSIGAALCGLLLAATGDRYDVAFAAGFVLSLAPLFAVARYLEEPARHSGPAPGPPASAAPSGEAGKKEKSGLLPIVIFGFLSACTARMITQFFPILAIEYGGLSTAQTSLIYAVSLVILIGAGPLFGWLSDNVSRKMVLMVRGIASTISSACFYFFPTLPGLAAGNVLDSLGKAAFRPAWGAMMARVARLNPRRRARTMSYLSLGEGLGETLGPILGGFLWSTWGIGAMLGARVALALLGEVYAVIVARTDQ